MSATLRFVVRVDRSWKVTYICQSGGTAWNQERQLRRLPEQPDLLKGQFPLPPAAELIQLPNNGNNESALTAMDELEVLWTDYDKITRRIPDNDSVPRFGRYLFDTLIGSEIWRNIIETAKQEAADVIELALTWQKSEHYLHRLNWEMMCGPDGFLARGFPKTVAITRLVENEPGRATGEERQIRPPPRVLFVIGTPLTDRSLRPGAEFLGLLRQLRSSRSRRSIHSLIVDGKAPGKGASPRQVKAAVTSFRPDVIHFICHGNYDAKSGRGYLTLEPDDSETPPERYADQLLGDILASDSYPPIVVLSACYSATPGTASPGTMLATEHMAPLAAEMVAGGVPVVIGMAGRISDRACRLFTRRFGEALVDGKPLVTVAAEGRLAAFVEGAVPQKSVDWAFPALFMSEDIRSGYVPVRVEDVDPASVIEERIESYQLLHEPVFCGREKFFQVFYDLFNPRERSRPVLLIYAEEDNPGLGRTRLLHELTAQAIRDGHVPCLLSPLPGDRVPTNVAQLGVEILKAIADARRIFSLGPPMDSVLLKLLDGVKPFNDLDALKSALRDEPGVLFATILGRYLEKDENGQYRHLDKNLLNEDQVRAALQADLRRLIQDAREKYPLQPDARYPVISDASRAVVLLDDVDQYGEELQDALLFRMLGARGALGLGTPEEPVPVVMTFSLTRANKQLVQWVKENKTAPGWIRLLELMPFQSDGEDMLAYERVLMHPSEQRRALEPGVSDVPWTVNDQVEAHVATGCQIIFRGMLLGMPIRFAEGPDIYNLAKGACELRYLIEADDEEILKGYLSKLGSEGLLNP